MKSYKSYGVKNEWNLKFKDLVFRKSKNINLHIPGRFVFDALETTKVNEVAFFENRYRKEILIDPVSWQLVIRKYKASI